MAQWKEGGWSRGRVTVPRLFSSTAGNRSWRTDFSFRILGHHSYLETNNESWNPQILVRERMGVIPWFHLLSSYSLFSQPSWLSGMSCVCPRMSSLSVHGGTESAEMPSKEFIRGKTWTSCCVLSTGLPPAGKLLWTWEFPAPCELPNTFHCFLQLCWVPFPAAARGGEHQEGTTFVLLGLPWRSRSRDTRGWEQRDSAPAPAGPAVPSTVPVPAMVALPHGTGRAVQWGWCNSR